MCLRRQCTSRVLDLKRVSLPPELYHRLAVTPINSRHKILSPLLPIAGCLSPVFYIPEIGCVIRCDSRTCHRSRRVAHSRLSRAVCHRCFARGECPRCIRSGSVHNRRRTASWRAECWAAFGRVSASLWAAYWVAAVVDSVSSSSASVATFLP